MNPQSLDEQADNANTGSLLPVREISEIPEIETATSHSGSHKHASLECVNSTVESSMAIAAISRSDSSRMRNHGGQVHGPHDTEISPAVEGTPSKQYSKRPSYHHHLKVPPPPKRDTPKTKRGLKVPLRRMTEQDNVEQEGRFELDAEAEPEPEAPPPPVEEPKPSLMKRLSTRTGSKISIGSLPPDRSGLVSGVNKGQQASFKAPSHSSSTYRPLHISITVRELMLQARFYKPPTLEDQSRHGPSSKGSVDGRALSDDDEPTEKKFRLRSVGPYLFAFCVMFLAAFDTIALLVLQVFRTEGDWLCTTAEPAAINYSNLHVAIALLCYHALILLSLVTTKSWASFRVRVFGLARSGGHGAYTLVMFCSVVLLIVHCRLCAAHRDGPLDFCTMSDSYRTIRRLHLLVHLFRGMVAIDSCFQLRNLITRRLQTAVSSNKRRYIDSEMKLDLDLTYVCDRIIAMALPCVAGAMYRNNIREVAHFFAMHHYGRFKVFNLCESYEEKGNGNYDRLLLFDQVERITMRDHHICPLRIFVAFMEHISAWMDRDAANVVAIHCLGGKGRTGAFVCGLMMWAGMFRTASDAMYYYAGRRTDRTRGTKRVQSVSAPCQIRYLFYLQAVLRFDFNYLAAHRRIVTKVQMQGAELRHLSGGAITIVLESSRGIEYDHCKACRLEKLDEMELGDGPGRWIRTFEVGEVLVGHDFSVRFFYFDKKVNIPTLLEQSGEICPGGKGIRYGHTVAKRLMEVTIHTAFHDGDHIEFSRDEVDGAHNQSHDKIPDEFKVVLHFVPESGGRSSSLHPAHPLSLQDAPAPSFSNTPHPVIGDGSSGAHTPRRHSEQHALGELEAIHSGLPLETASDADSTLAGHSDSLGCAVGCLRHKDYLPFLYAEGTAARRAVDRRALLYRIFGRCSGPSRTFYKGEIISGDSAEESWPTGGPKSVFLIVRGAVSVSRTHNLHEHNTFSNTSILGEGELVGIREFLLGMERGKSGLVAKARTDRVVVRHLMAKPDESAAWGIQHILETIEGTPNKDPNKHDSDSEADDEDGSPQKGGGEDGVSRSMARRNSALSVGARSASTESSECKSEEIPFSLGSDHLPPLRFEGLGSADVYILYEELLYELSLRSHSLEKTEMSIAVQSDEVKVASEISTGQAEKVNLTRLARQRFDIPIMEGCALTLFASTTTGGGKEGADLDHAGRLLIFSQRLCFMDEGKDVQILASDILSANANGETLEIALHQPAPGPGGEDGTIREHFDSLPSLIEMAKRPALRSKNKRMFRPQTRTRSPLVSSGQSGESTDSGGETPSLAAMESATLGGEGSQLGAFRRGSSMAQYSQSHPRLPSAVSEASVGGSSKLPAMGTFTSSEKMVGTGVRNKTVTNNFRSSLAVFKRDASEESFDHSIVQFRLKDPPKCQAACKLITRILKGVSMFNVPPSRPELPIISMPPIEGDSGGFLPSDVIELFNYVGPNEIVPKETMDELERAFRVALLTSQLYWKGSVVAKFGAYDTGVLHVLHGSLSLRLADDPKGINLQLRGRGSVMCERFLHPMGNGGIDYTIVAEEDTLCFFLRFEVLESLAACHPEVAARICRALAVLVAKRDQQLLMDLYIGSTQKP